jgi:DNA-directed RNA polymerase specialized sigma24 family protein
MSDEDKEDCYQEIQDKLQGCNCRRLRMWNRKMARFSTYLGTIAKRTCIDFRRKKKRERGEPVKEDENLELLEDFAMEEDEIEKLAAPDRHPLAEMVDREFMEEIELRLREFLEERLTK